MQNTSLNKLTNTWQESLRGSREWKWAKRTYHALPQALHDFSRGHQEIMRVLGSGPRSQFDEMLSGERRYRKTVFIRYAATMHFLGQSTILALTRDRGTGETYCMPHHLSVDGEKRRLMIAALRYYGTFVKLYDVWLFAERLPCVDWIEERDLS